MSLWPDLPATLFGYDARFPKANAHVEWVLNRRDVEGYKEGYRRAAMHLAQVVLANEDSPEYLVWPIAWLWRHHLELALKDIIAVGPMLAEGEDEGKGQWAWPTGLRHGLMSAWTDALPFIMPHGDPNSPTLVHAGAIIAEFDALDPDGAGFRYPLNYKGGRSLATAPSHINVGLLDETMQRLSNFLAGVRDCQARALEYITEHEAQARAEYERDYRE